MLNNKCTKTATVLGVTAVPRTSMKRKRARPQTAQEIFFGVFAGDEHLWSRMSGHIQGDGHATKTGDVVVLGTACGAHGGRDGTPVTYDWK